MTHFITKVTPIIIIYLVSVEVLCRLTEKIRTCSSRHTGSIMSMPPGAGTYTHTHIVDKSNFKKPIMHWHLAGMCLIRCSYYSKAITLKMHYLTKLTQYVQTIVIIVSTIMIMNKQYCYVCMLHAVWSIGIEYACVYAIVFESLIGITLC